MSNTPYCIASIGIVLDLVTTHIALQNPIFYESTPYGNQPILYFSILLGFIFLVENLGKYWSRKYLSEDKELVQKTIWTIINLLSLLPYLAVAYNLIEMCS